MSLQKVSRMRVAEELNRGFDILTNGHLRGGLAKIEATNFMQEKPKVWNQISPRNQEDAGAAQASQASHLNVDFNNINFERRSKRLNTNLAPTPQAAPS